MPGAKDSSDGGRFGAALRRHREERELSQEALAVRARVSVETIGNLERGRVRRPRHATATLLAQGLGLDGEERDAFLALIPAAPEPEAAPPGELPKPVASAGRRHWRRPAALLGLTALVSLLMSGTGAALALHWVGSVGPSVALEPAVTATPATTSTPTGTTPAPGPSASAPAQSTAAPAPIPTPVLTPSSRAVAGSLGTVPVGNVNQALTVNPNSTSNAPPSSIKFSFEDGGTDGWFHKGHVTAFQNAAVAHDGARSLQVSLFSSNSNDLPWAAVGVSGAGAPQPGQTIALYVLAAPEPARILGQAFFQDAQSTWHIGGPIWLPPGGWTRLTVTVPARVEVNQVGVQFLGSPTNAGATAYIDSVGWS